MLHLSEVFWIGFEGDLKLRGGKEDSTLRASIRPCDSRDDAPAALEAFRKSNPVGAKTRFRRRSRRMQTGIGNNDQVDLGELRGIKCNVTNGFFVFQCVLASSYTNMRRLR